MCAKFRRAWRSRKLAMAGATIGRGLQSFDDFFAGVAKGFTCGSGVYLARGCKIMVASHGRKSGKLRIGRNVFVNHYTIIDCHHSISIGDSVLIGPQCYICDYDHGVVRDCVIGAQPDGLIGAVSIGDEAWIGAGVIILKGVTVGAGAVIGAGSVITRDVEPMTIVAGSPARLLRVR